VIASRHGSELSMDFDAKSGTVEFIEDNQLNNSKPNLNNSMGIS